jgi:hypothetical protein
MHYILCYQRIVLQSIKKQCERSHKSVKILKNIQKQMQVTEHNLTDWNLNEEELNALIKLSKEKSIACREEDKMSELFYGLIAGKLIIMKNEEKEI